MKTGTTGHYLVPTIMAPLHRGRFLVVHLYSSFSMDPLDFFLGANLYQKLLFLAILAAVMPKLHLFDLLWICCTTSCTTNPQQIEAMEFGFDLLWTCCSVAANQRSWWRTCDVTNFRKQMVVIIGKMDNWVENLRPIQLTTGSLIDAYQNESVGHMKISRRNAITGTNPGY